MRIVINAPVSKRQFQELMKLLKQMDDFLPAAAIVTALPGEGETSQEEDEAEDYDDWY